LANDVVDIESEASTTRLNDWLATNGVASESLVEMVKLKVPLCEGVPASTPEVLKVKPVGKVPEARFHL
jgi:hypothetical protein